MEKRCFASGRGNKEKNRKKHKMDDFQKAMSDWISLKKTLAQVGDDLKKLRTREKELKSYISTYMKESDTKVVNLRKGKVTLKVSERRGALSKEAVKKGLLIYFQEDEIKTESALNCIFDNLDIKTSHSISLTGLPLKGNA